MHVLHFSFGLYSCPTCAIEDYWAVFLQSDAREICQIISKAFEMVYTEATMAQLEDAIENDERATSVQSQGNGVGFSSILYTLF